MPGQALDVEPDKHVVGVRHTARRSGCIRQDDRHGRLAVGVAEADRASCDVRRRGPRAGLVGQPAASGHVDDRGLEVRHVPLSVLGDQGLPRRDDVLRRDRAHLDRSGRVGSSRDDRLLLLRGCHRLPRHRAQLLRRGRSVRLDPSFLLRVGRRDQARCRDADRRARVRLDRHGEDGRVLVVARRCRHISAALAHVCGGPPGHSASDVVRRDRVDRHVDRPESVVAGVCCDRCRLLRLRRRVGPALVLQVHRRGDVDHCLRQGRHVHGAVLGVGLAAGRDDVLVRDRLHRHLSQEEARVRPDRLPALRRCRVLVLRRDAAAGVRACCPLAGRVVEVFSLRDVRGRCRGVRDVRELDVHASGSLRIDRRDALIGHPVELDVSCCHARLPPLTRSSARRSCRPAPR